MSATITSTSKRTSGVRGTNIALNRAVAVAAATATAIVGWVGIHVVGDVELTIGSGRDAVTVGASQVALSAMTAALCGWALLAVVERRLGPGRRAVARWRWICLGLLAASLVGPLGADAATSTSWWLVALHTSVAAVFIPTMSRTCTDC